MLGQSGVIHSIMIADRAQSIHFVYTHLGIHVAHLIACMHASRGLRVPISSRTRLDVATLELTIAKSCNHMITGTRTHPGIADSHNDKQERYGRMHAAA